MRALLITDEKISGEVLYSLELRFKENEISVADLIKERVNREVEKFQTIVDEENNLTADKIDAHALVLPTDLEKRLNAHKDNKALKIDINKQIDLAWKAFQNNGFFILIDDQQAEDLQQKFVITDTTKVSFIKLTPLVGG